MEVFEHAVCPVDNGIQVHKPCHTPLLAGHQVAHVSQRQVLCLAYLLRKRHIFWILLVHLLEVSGEGVAYVPMVRYCCLFSRLPQVCPVVRQQVFRPGLLLVYHGLHHVLHALGRPVGCHLHVGHLHVRMLQGMPRVFGGCFQQQEQLLVAHGDAGIHNQRVCFTDALCRTLQGRQT